MSNTFKVGDRVRVIKRCDGASVGMVGTILVIKNSFPMPIGVKFDEKFLDGHSLTGRCKHGFGHWLHPEDLELLADNYKVVITTDGKTTLARLYDGSKVVKSAEAKCSPIDTFDFAVGSKLAFERLFEESDEKICEVKRSAKKGEYIKIVNAQQAHGYYKNGDIYQVAQVKKSFISDIFGGFGTGVYFEIPGVETIWDDGMGFAWENEYVVLEGYKPEPPKYKVGDYVKIREDLKLGERYRSPYGAIDTVVSDMIDMAGKTVTITDVLEGDCEGKYRTAECGYNWVDTMFEGIADEPIRYYNGRVCCIKDFEGLTTVGKIYEFKDGEMQFDNGHSSSNKVKTFAEIEKNFSSKFIEIKE